MNSSKNQNIWKYAVMNTEKSIKYSTESMLFKFIKVLYFIALIYTFVINLAVILGQVFNIQDLSTVAAPTSTQTANLLAAKNMLLLAVIATIMYVSGIILLSKKLATAFLAVNILPSVILLITFRMYMSDSILSNGPLQYFIRHGIPLSLLILFSALLFIICFFEKHKRKTEYNRLINCLYSYFSEKDEKVISNADFEECLNNYDGFEIKANINKPLKRSEKARKRKHEQEQEKESESDSDEQNEI